MKKFLTLFSLICVLGLGVFLLLPEGTDAESNGSMPALKELAENVTVIPGHTIKADWAYVGTPKAKKLLEGKSTMGGRNQQIAAVNQDCWTIDEMNLIEFGPEGEWYTFGPNDFIFFVDKIKIPAEGIPDGLGLDQLFVKCVPVVNRPFKSAAPPYLFVDDIYLGVIDGVGHPIEIMVVWDMPASALISTFGAPSNVDWYVGKEYHANLMEDFDGDTFPDWFVEFAPIPPGVFYLWIEPDECGGWLINWLEGNSAGAIVIHYPFDTVPSLPPRPTLPGMVPGEDGETRPWCFELRSI
jgi:hypothetical protein